MYILSSVIIINNLVDITNENNNLIGFIIFSSNSKPTFRLTDYWYYLYSSDPMKYPEKYIFLDTFFQFYRENCNCFILWMFVCLLLLHHLHLHPSTPLFEICPYQSESSHQAHYIHVLQLDLESHYNILTKSRTITDSK